MSRRAQGAVEFVFISTVMLLFFTAAFIVAQTNYIKVQDARYQESIQFVFDRVEAEINAANQAGDGYEREFSIPRTLGGIPYELDLALNETPQAKDALILRIQEEEYFRFSRVAINGSLSTGAHLIRGGNPVQITTLP